MIIQNARYGNTENVTVAEFGTGDIHMMGSEKAKVDVCGVFSSYVDLKS